MLQFVMARIAQAILAVFAVVTLVFLLARINGDPAVLLAPPNATTDDVMRLRHALGLDKPLIDQYGSYLWSLLHGDLGRSTSYSAPVRQLALSAFGHTLVLSAVAFVFAVVVGVGMGLVSGMRPGGGMDFGGRIVSLIGQSVPSFWLGILLILAFAVHLHVLPAVGDHGVKSVVLPALALGAYSLAAFSRLTRASVIEIMNKDQTLFLRSKGSGTVAVVGHVLRNASLPQVTLVGIQLGHLISGTVVIEVLFGWPGIGQLAIQAISSRDYALIQGVVVVNAAVFVILLLIVDISYGFLDPRIRRAHARSGS